MSSKRYPEEFRIEAVKQVTERGHAVADVAAAADNGIAERNAIYIAFDGMSIYVRLGVIN